MARLVAARAAGRLPAVVLVHESLPGAGTAQGAAAHALLRLLPRILGPVPAPLCALAAARLDPPDAYAFCLAGGAIVLDVSRQSWAERVATLRAGMRGERWTHRPSPPLIRLTTRDLELLACLDADLSPNQAARVLSLTDQQVHDSRRALHARLVKAGAVDFVLSGHTRALARAALAAGAIWKPLTADQRDVARTLRANGD